MKNSHRSTRSSHRRHGNTFVLVLLLVAAVWIVGVMIAISQTTTQATPSASSSTTDSAAHYAAPGSTRTLTFSASNVLDSDKNHAHVSLLQGKLPSGITQVKVLTDENCAPDGQGVSHCLNRLSYSGGEITVRHNHKMADVPCLQPGEVLQVVS